MASCSTPRSTRPSSVSATQMEQPQNTIISRLPPGFRFHPTDEELVLQYLRRKVFSFPVPASIIPEFDANRSDPWDLPGDTEQERYFFCRKEIKYPNGSRSNRATAGGYWKATGLDKQIVVRNHVVGMKKTLVFYLGKPPKGCKTDWVLHEYRLLNAACQGTLAPLPVEETWVLCRMLLKKRRSTKGNVTEPRRKEQGFVFYDFMAKEKADSSSGSSGVTQILIRKQEQEDEEEEAESSSCGNSFTVI